MSSEVIQSTLELKLLSATKPFSNWGVEKGEEIEKMEMHGVFRAEVITSITLKSKTKWTQIDKVKMYFDISVQPKWQRKRIYLIFFPSNSLKTILSQITRQYRFSNWKCGNIYECTSRCYSFPATSSASKQPAGNINLLLNKHAYTYPAY